MFYQIFLLKFDIVKFKIKTELATNPLKFHVFLGYVFKGLLVIFLKTKIISEIPKGTEQSLGS